MAIKEGPGINSDRYPCPVLSSPQLLTDPAHFNSDSLLLTLHSFAVSILSATKRQVSAAVVGDKRWYNPGLGLTAVLVIKRMSMM